MKLKKYLLSLLMAMAIVTLMPSCSIDNDVEVVTDDHCFISAFTMGTLKRTIYTTTETGEDSTYTVTFSASAFPMSIDQRSLIIENKDSLPYGTRVDAVLATVTYQGVIAYKKALDVDWTTYSDKDSIDFTSPVEFVVYSSTGTSERHYTVKLNVHKQDGSRFVWNQQAEIEGLGQLANRKMVVNDGSLVMMAETAAGEVLCATCPASKPQEWTITAATGAEMADVNTLLVDGKGRLLMSNKRGAVLQSADGTNWQVLVEAEESRQLVGASSDRLYAVTKGLLQSSGDDGKTWQEEMLDDDASLLPDRQYTLIQREQDNGYVRLILMGCNATTADGKAVVWSKAWNSISSEEKAQWMYYPHTADNVYLCPQREPLFVLPYDDGLISFGGKSTDGKKEALGAVLYSPDYGLTWSNRNEIMLPSALSGTNASLAATVDADNFLWIVAGKQVWRGRLNRLGFERK